jgi:hypothetical protein
VKGAIDRVRAYLAALPPDARRRLEGVRRIIRAAVPDAVESFSEADVDFRRRMNEPARFDRIIRGSS